MRITIVEDNELLSQAVALRLQDAGHSVTRIADGADADAFLRSDTTDILILDVNLPTMDGLQLLQNIRRRKSTIPVLMLTARDGVQDRVDGLDSGADDYLVKPFEMSELEARIRVLARRVVQPTQLVETIGELSYNLGAHTIQVGDEVLSLPRREAMVFECLAINRGQLISKSRIAEHVFGLDGAPDDKAIETYISRLRKKITPYGVKINAARGLGYMLDEDKGV